MPKPKSNQARRNDIQVIALEFHKRAFGEEMARVNLLSVAERRKYLSRLRQRSGGLAVRSVA